MVSVSLNNLPHLVVLPFSLCKKHKEVLVVHKRIHVRPFQLELSETVRVLQSSTFWKGTKVMISKD